MKNLEYESRLDPPDDREVFGQHRQMIVEEDKRLRGKKPSALRNFLLWTTIAVGSLGAGGLAANKLYETYQRVTKEGLLGKHFGEDVAEGLKRAVSDTFLKKR